MTARRPLLAASKTARFLVSVLCLVSAQIEHVLRVWERTVAVELYDIHITFVALPASLKVVNSPNQTRD